MNIFWLLILFLVFRVFFEMLEIHLENVPYNKINRTVIPDWKYPVPPPPAKHK